jgi:DNA-directed RNA polymerase specialized sigma24 family protein
MQLKNDPPQSERLTLGDILYPSSSQAVVSESDWAALVQAMALGGGQALKALYKRTHRLVFTLLVRITGNRQLAEELMLDTFCDAWRQSSRFDPANATVLGWVMNLARAAAIDRLRFDYRDVFKGELAALHRVLGASNSWTTDILRPAASVQRRLAERIGAKTPEEPLPQMPPWSEPEWTKVAPRIACKLLATDAPAHRVSMLVRLAPEGEYPPHTHSGVEELHLLDGELWIDERKLYPGDYNRAESGTGDQHVWSETGCTCVLITSTRDVLR